MAEGGQRDPMKQSNVIGSFFCCCFAFFFSKPLRLIHSILVERCISMSDATCQLIYNDDKLVNQPGWDA